MEMGDFGRCVIDAGEALRLESYHPDASMLYGYALLRVGQDEQALTFLRQAVLVHRDSGDLRCLLGRAYEARGDRSKAMSCYNQAVELEPANNLARQLLASAAGAPAR
jgi:Flp pilus assembly protein TadD